MLQRIRRIAFFSLIGIVATLGAVAAGIQYTDWTRYKAGIVDQINQSLLETQGERAGQAPLSIDGELEVKIFPAPRLVMEGLQIQNIAGGASSNLLKSQQLELVSSWGNLLSGDLRVQSLKLIGTEISVEIGPDGRTNFEHLFSGVRSEAEAGAVGKNAAESVQTDAGPLVETANTGTANTGTAQAESEQTLFEAFFQSLQQIDQIELEGAQISCRDVLGAGCLGRPSLDIADLNGSLQAEADGNYVVTLDGLSQQTSSQGADINAQLRLSNLVSDQPTAIDFQLLADDSKITFIGIYDRFSEIFLDGNLTVEADEFDEAFLDGLFGKGAGETMSVDMLMPAHLTGALAASGEGLYEWDGFEGKFDTMGVSGSIAFDSTSGNLQGHFFLDQFDLDGLVESQPDANVHDKTAFDDAEDGALIAIETEDMDATLDSNDFGSTAFSDTSNSTLRKMGLNSWQLAGTVRKLVIGGETLESVQFEANRQNIHSSKASGGPFAKIDGFNVSAPLPWGGGLVLNGLADVSMAQAEFDIGYGLRFEEASRGLAWLGLEDLPFKMSGGKWIESTGRLTGTQTDFQIRQANIKADALNLNGSVQVSQLDGGRDIYIQAETNAISLDHWLPVQMQEDIAEILPASKSRLTAALGLLPLGLEAISPHLDDETNDIIGLSLTAKSIQYSSDTYRGVKFVGRIDRQGITINEFEAEDQGGVKTALVGLIPTADGEDTGLRGDVTAPTFGAFFDSLGTRPDGPLWARDGVLSGAGPMTLSWIHRGNPLGEAATSEADMQKTLEIAVRSGEAALELKGSLGGTKAPDACRFIARLTHGSARSAYSLLAAPYPITPPDQPVTLQGRIQGCGETISLSELSGEIGAQPISGEIKISDKQISGMVTMTTLDLDEWLSNSPVHSYLPTPLALTPITASGEQRSWSRTKLPEQWLTAAGNWTLHAQTLRRGDLTITDAAFDFGIQDETFAFTACSGRLYGGNFTCSYQREAGGDLAYTLELRNVTLGDRLLGLAGVDLARSTVNLDLSAQTTGGNELERVSQLQARGRFLAQGGDLIGMNFAPLAEGYGQHGSTAKDIAKSYEQALSSGQTPLDSLALNFNVEGGVFASRNLEIRTGSNLNMTANYALRYNLLTGELDNLGDLEGSAGLDSISVRHVGKIGASRVRIDDQALADSIGDIEFEKLQRDLTTPLPQQTPDEAGRTGEGTIGDILKDVLQGD